MKRIYTLAELESLPTLSVSQADDLKIDTGTSRVWLSRLGFEDGEPYENKVTIERLEEFERSARTKQYHKSAHWVIDYTYQAK